ncbi:diacylglycerol kinase family protein [Haladaptatus caseinilyticus]|uniref:hypothetical protein n=1 Tax=Haladaptatus caseinilyticus TaxID=2993314 RepID=UPI00224B130F|nr:hypothetical protein [Haladaptatus caseinilyticus]
MGLFDVVIVEEMSTSDIVADAASHRLLGQDTDHVHHMQVKRLEIDSLHDEPIELSLDSELSTHEHLALQIRPQKLTVCAGPEYVPRSVPE